MSNESEKSIIGSILIDPECLHNLYDYLKPEAFQTQFYREVYTNALAMYTRGETIDLVLLSEKCANEQVTSEQYKRWISDAVMDTPTSIHHKEYADEVMKDFRSRRLAELLTNVKTHPNDVDDSIAELMTRLSELQVDKKQRSKSLAEIVQENQYNYFNSAAKKKIIYTGFRELDNYLEMTGGNTYIIGARPSVGKSAFANQLAIAMAKRGNKVGIFSLEMSDSEIYERLIAKESEIELTRIKKANNFLGDEQPKFTKANERLAKLKIDISSGAKTDLDIMEECRYQNYDVIIVDYLQLVEGSKRAENRRVDVGNVSRNFKKLAMDLNIPVILLSQLTRGVEHSNEKEPTMADLRETGDIEQDASGIILLWNLSQNIELRDYKGLKLCKNRGGELFEENIIFVGKTMDFFENDKATLESVKSWIKTSEKNKIDDNPFETSN